MLLRSMIRDVTDEEIDVALEALRGSDVLERINEEGDIDRPYTLAAKVFSRDPSLMMLIPRYIPRLLKAFRS
jgi:hypothetical protein